jgi:hypothetical protein
VASVVRTFMEEKTEWAGVTKDLMTELTALAGERLAKSKGWPRNERQLTDRLKKAVTFLRYVQLNIVWAETRTNRGREITITAYKTTPGSPSQPSQFGENSEIINNLKSMNGDGRRVDTVTGRTETVTPSPRPSPQKPLKIRASDGRDGCDGDAGASSQKPEAAVDAIHADVEQPCAHCGKGGALPFAYGGLQADLHPRCRHDWLVDQGHHFEMPPHLRRERQ